MLGRVLVCVRLLVLFVLVFAWLGLFGHLVEPC